MAASAARDQQIHLYLTKAEREYLDQTAGRLGMTAAAVLRNSARQTGVLRQPTPVSVAQLVHRDRDPVTRR